MTVDGDAEDADGLIDVSDLSLADVQKLPKTVLGDVLRRIAAQTEEEPVAGFQSAI